MQQKPLSEYYQQASKVADFVSRQNWKYGQSLWVQTEQLGKQHGIREEETGDLIEDLEKTDIRVGRIPESQREDLELESVPAGVFDEYRVTTGDRSYGINVVTSNRGKTEISIPAQKVSYLDDNKEIKYHQRDGFDTVVNGTDDCSILEIPLQEKLRLEQQRKES